ncbi:MAG: helix-turn-helix domain-containing protein [Methylococcaceae bacterium]
MDWKALFKEIEKRMREKNMTYLKLAKKLKIDPDITYAWFTRYCEPRNEKTIKSLVLALRFLDVDIKEFSDTKTIGGRIKCLRLKKGLTVYSMTLKLSVSSTTYNYWEAGTTKQIKDCHITVIANALDSTPDYIVNGDKKEPKNGLVDLSQPKVQMTFEEAMPVENKKPFDYYFDLNNDSWGDVIASLEEVDESVKEFASRLIILEVKHPLPRAVISYLLL